MPVQYNNVMNNQNTFAAAVSGSHSVTSGPTKNATNTNSVLVVKKETVVP